MIINIKNYKLENDVEAKAIPDGYEIFSDAVEKHGISPDDFESAVYGFGGSIIVYKE